jgi:capsular polysaccharide biosynthesis protein
VNRDAVDRLFRECDYTIFNFKDRSFSEQLSYLGSASIIVMEAGSSICNLLFCRPSTRIGEHRLQLDTEILMNFLGASEAL